jgi:hypothetical protein
MIYSNTPDLCTNNEEYFHGSTQPLQVNAGIIPSIRPNFLHKKIFTHSSFRSRDSVVSIATGYGLDDQEFRV